MASLKRTSRAASSFASLLIVGGVSSLSERDNLVRLYNLANGRHWVKSDGWRHASEFAANGDDGSAIDASEYASVCSWHGITCGQTEDKDDTVTEIDLSYNHLSGKVSHHLWSLPNLKVANLHGNLITDAGLLGFASTDASPKSPIETLYLSENRLTSLEGISSAPTTLRKLHVGSNAFEGHFPEEVFRLKKLHVLRASYNAGITGTLSSHIGDMTSLKELELSYTALRGEIPTELGSLGDLEFLSLDNNRLHGTIPFELEELVKLKYLSIQNSEPGSGKITGSLPAFKDCSDLKQLYLNDNGLSGPIPSDLLEFSLLTDKEVTVGLRNNKLSGRVPSELGKFERLHLEIGGNKINGLPQELCSKNKWMTGAVKSYGCDAIMCPKGTFRAESGRREGEEDTCQECPNGVKDAPHFGSTGCGESGGASTSDGSGPGGGSAGGSVGGSGSSGSPGNGSSGGSGYATTSSSPSSSTSAASGGGMSGGAKFAIVLISLVGFFGAVLIARIAVRRRRNRREAMKEAELERHEQDGVVFDAADAGANSDMLDVPLGNGPGSPGVNRCIL